ncbi:MAG: HAD-IIA family hydrolase [Candidatus Aerophobetes bacterium]|nr:HAD-IIA family hydrolase [Candidatus Aerophobetes bacterium]
MSLYIFDLDGVIYRGGEKLLPGAEQALSFLKERGEEICFLSNNSTLSRSGYVKRFTRLGIRTHPVNFFPSSYLAAIYFTENEERKNGKVLVIGEEGLFEELKEAKVKITSNPEEASYVVAGMDWKFNFEKLCLAHKAILKGAKFIATNIDLTFPVEEGTLPGAGAIIKAIEASTGKSPLLLGKPETFGIETVMKKRGYSPEDTILIGDRLETDILAGKRAGAVTVLVLSGITRREDLKKAPPSHQPDYIISSLREFPSLIISGKY